MNVICDPGLTNLAVIQSYLLTDQLSCIIIMILHESIYLIAPSEYICIKFKNLIKYECPEINVCLKQYLIA